MSPPSKILLVQLAADISGSAISGRLIAEGLLAAGMEVEVVFGYEGPIIDQYRDIGCGTHIVPHKSWLRRANFARSFRNISTELINSQALRKLAKQLQPDLIYVNSIVSLAGVVAAYRLGIPCVWHIRELFQDIGGEMYVPSFGGRRFVRSLLKLPDQVVCISNAVAENILQGARSDCTIIPNAVSEHSFDLSLSSADCKQHFRVPSGSMIVGVPGTLRPMKGHTFFLDAALQIPDCHFVITGDGEASFVHSLKQKVRDLGIEDRTHFLGTVSDMQYFYRMCDVICIPSRAEPFGRTVIEAFAAQLPVVASNVGGIREIIDHEQTGLLVEYGDISALAHQINRLLTNDSLRFALATSAREKAERNYKKEIYQQRILNIVTPLITVPRRPEPNTA